jgi:hypothetical protein
MNRLTALLLTIVLMLGACSMRSAMEGLMSDEDKAFSTEMVNRLRSGDGAWLQERFDPELWARVGKDAAAAGQHYPSVPGTTELTSFSVSSGTTNGAYERRKEFSLVTHGGGRWTTTHFKTHSTGGPDRVVEFSVTPSATEPPELAMLNGLDRALPWIQAAMVAVLIGVGFLVFWLVRRSRRRMRDPLEGRPPA